MAEERIRVSARIRPLSAQEEERGETCALYVQDDRTVAVWGGPEREPPRSGGGTPSKRIDNGNNREPDVALFGFDATFDSPAGSDGFLLQEHVYQQLGRPLLQDALDGISGCLFAYGISGSGKTFSLLGSEDAPGVLPRLAEELLQAKDALKNAGELEELSVKAAFLELYNENLVDLLSESREPLRLYEHSLEGVLVPGLSEREIAGPEEFAELLDIATRSRSVGVTGANAHSSRSHALIQLRLQRFSGDSVSRAKIHIIDLAGSERQKRAQNEGTRMKEGIHINVSLSALGLVISRLSEIAQGRNHCSVPFRDSKLTFLLKDSLTGNARTQMLIALSPASSCYEESLSSLRFAQSVKRIATRSVADVARLGAPTAEVQALQGELSRLRAELEASRAVNYLRRGPAQRNSDCNPASNGIPDDPKDPRLQHLEGRYLSPTDRLIQVGGDGSVRFLGGNGHHPIRIVHDSQSGESLPEGEAIGRKNISSSVLRLESEGDPSYRYLLVSEDDGGLMWRHVENEDFDETVDVYWRRVSTVGDFSHRVAPEVDASAQNQNVEELDLDLDLGLDPPGQEALLAIRLAASGGSGEALAGVATAAPALAQAVGPDQATEVLEALICLCADLDEVNALLAKCYEQHRDRPYLQATWLSPEANRDALGIDLLHVRVFGQPGRALPGIAQLWSLPEFALRFEAMRRDVDISLSKSNFQGLQLRCDRFWNRSLLDGRGESVVEQVENHGAHHFGRPASATPVGRPGPSALQSRPAPAVPPAPSISSGIPGIPGGLASSEAGSFRGPGSQCQQSRLAAARARRSSGTFETGNARSPSPPPLPQALPTPTPMPKFSSARSVPTVLLEPDQARTEGQFNQTMLLGRYRSTSGVPVLVDQDGRVDFGGKCLELAPEGEKVLLRNPEDSSYGPYRLVCVQADGVLLWEFDGDSEACTTERPRALSADDVHLLGSGSPRLAWTPQVAEDAPFDEERPGPVVPLRREQQLMFSLPGSQSTPRRPPQELGNAAKTSGHSTGLPAIGRETSKDVRGSRAVAPHGPGLHTPRPASADPSSLLRDSNVSSSVPPNRERHRRSPTPMRGGAAFGSRPERCVEKCTERRAQSAVPSRPKLGVAAGSGEANVAPRAFDKNSLRLRNGSIFVDALAKWRDAYSRTMTVPARRLMPGMCAVYVRKRPLSDRDTRRCDFDVLSVVRASTSDDREKASEGLEIVHHACMFDRTGMTPFFQHTQFPFDSVFDVDASNEAVYRTVGRPLLETALEGNLATLFIFGQTGSGKTFTMRAIERMVAEELFEHLGEGAQVSLTYFELAGRKALDLLTEQKSEIRLREEEDGCFRPHDCEELLFQPTTSSAEELLRAMGEAAQRRATDATAANSSSSRSHAVCRISISRPDRRAVGRLLLVDCAGTERSRDSLFFKGQHVKESAEINSSLFALKDCIRCRQAAIQKQGGLPQDGLPLRLPSVRATLLTKVLAESLISPSAQLMALATVSPNATDAEHTLDTLRTVYTLSGRPEARITETRQVLEVG
ncbi:unnamed protein product [Polarella glacialis]|uniref:Kinesin motor domain-containing protein n=1 Tax=Polarella glacialis TaxID=89957 RepID=A0A813EBL0_POLGL|nr:unnamed protein product [Polarella glacialis]